MKQIVLLSILCLSSLVHSQVDSIPPNLIPDEVDSIQFSVWLVYTKEMLPPGKEEEEGEKKLEQSTLEENDQKILLMYLQDSASYNYERAMLHHYNLVFNFYVNGKVLKEVRISSMTGNVDIDNELGETYFRNRCSMQFGSVLITLLTNYGFIQLIDEYDLEGFEHYQEK